VLTLGESEALSSWSDNPARHPGGTLHGVFQWSWDLLTAHEQSALQQLAAFDDALSLEAIEGIIEVGDEFVEDLVQALLDKSMLVSPNPHQITTLIPVREFVRQHPLVDPDALMDRHSAWFAHWAEGMAARIDDVTDMLAVSEVRNDGRRHLLKALDRLAKTENPLAVKLLSPVNILYDIDADLQLLQVCQQLWGHDLLTTGEQIDIALHLSEHAFRSGQLEQAAQWIDEADRRVGNHTPVAQQGQLAARKIRAAIANHDMVAADTAYAAAIAIPGLPPSYQHLFVRYRSRGALGQELVDWWTKAYHALGDHWGPHKIEVSYILGALHMEMSRFEEGRLFLERTQRHAKRCKLHGILNETRGLLALLEGLNGDWASANTRMNKAYASMATESNVHARIFICLKASILALICGKTDRFQHFHEQMCDLMTQIAPETEFAEYLGFAALVQLQNQDRDAGLAQWQRLMPDLMAWWDVDETFCGQVWSHFESAFFSDSADDLAAAWDFVRTPPPYRADGTSVLYYLFWLRSLLQERGQT